MNKTDTPDEHAGKGGSYVLQDGKRVLQERTGYVQPQPVKSPPAPLLQKGEQPVKPKSNKEGSK